MDKRYQVFVSSTFRDLQTERSQVIQALLELDCIPSGMELFPASDDDQWTLIKRVIDDCDYYLVVIGGRYGSMDESGISYTEKEYDYAVEKSKPIIGFLHRDPDGIAVRNAEMEEPTRRKLADFRAKAEKRMCKYWKTPDELGGVVSRSLVQLIKTHPAEGWVRAGAVTNADEVLKLRRRLDDAEAKVQRFKSEPPQGTEELQQGDDTVKFDLEYFPQDAAKLKTVSVTVSWNELVGRLGPSLFHSSDERTLRESLAEQLLLFGKFPGGHPTISIDQFHTVLMQFVALGLIEKLPGRERHWTLTPFGQSCTTRIKARRRST